MTRLSRAAFDYSANVREAVEILLPRDPGAKAEVEAGRSLALHLAPVAHQAVPPGVRLMAIVDRQAWDALQPDEREPVLRAELAKSTIEAARCERAGETAPGHIYSSMDLAVQALKVLKKPVVQKETLGSTFGN